MIEIPEPPSSERARLVATPDAEVDLAERASHDVLIAYTLGLRPPRMVPGR